MTPLSTIDYHFKFSLMKMDSSLTSKEENGTIIPSPDYQAEDLSAADFDHTKVCSDLFQRLGYQQKGDYHIFRVFAPFAQKVSLSFKYEGKDRPFSMKCIGKGLWQLQMKDVPQLTHYQYLITTETGAVYRKIDPFSTCHSRRADPFFQHESVASTLDVSSFQDETWMKDREGFQTTSSPLLIYRMSPYHFKKVYGSHHLGFRNFYNESIEHLAQCGISHVLIEDLLDHINPSDLTKPWSLFHIAKEMGSHKQLQEMINSMHKANIGVMMKIPLDQFDPIEFGLSCYDGKALFHDEKLGYGMYNFTSTWTQSYILSAISFWIDYFHMDGFVITAPDAVESKGSLEKDDSFTSFVHSLTEYLEKHHPGVVLIEEANSTSSSKKTHFSLHKKEEQNSGTLQQEKTHITTLFPPTSTHDIDFFIRSYTLELTKMFTMKGVKMLDMGQELGQITPWKERVALSLQDSREAAVEWDLATQSSGSIILETCQKLQLLYKKHVALYPDALMNEIQTKDPSILAYTRESRDGTENILCIHNHSTKNIAIEDIKEIPLAGYAPLFSSVDHDDLRYLPAFSSTMLIYRR
jgi:1,4-alpha-glucan branching enzyme